MCDCAHSLPVLAKLCNTDGSISSCYSTSGWGQVKELQHLSLIYFWLGSFCLDAINSLRSHITLSTMDVKKCRQPVSFSASCSGLLNTFVYQSNETRKFSKLGQLRVRNLNSITFVTTQTIQIPATFQLNLKFELFKDLALLGQYNMVLGQLWIAIVVVSIVNLGDYSVLLCTVE